MGSWPREERRDNGCGLQLGSTSHDAVSIRAKPRRRRDAAHFFSRCVLLFCQSGEISLRHEANNSAEGLKAPTVCNALSGDLGGFSPRTSSVPAITTEVYPARAKRSAFSKRSSSGSSWSAIMSEHTKRFFKAVRFRTERPARRDARPSRRAQGGSAHRSRRHDERSLTIRGYSLPS